MKKLFGIVFAMMLIALPLGTYAQVEVGAGSLKIGVHADVSYRWADKDKDPPFNGYDSITMGDLAVILSGDLGDKVSYKITEVLVSTQMVGQELQPVIGAFPFEAYGDLKFMDLLTIRIGQQLTPTLLANTGVHCAKVIKTANFPLIATAPAVMGYNDPGKSWMPTSVTGVALILKIAGIEVNWTLFDGIYEWGRDTGDKGKGGNVAVTYTGEIGPGKLTARGFYYDELEARQTGYGVGAIYDAEKWFVGLEYASDSIKDVNDWSGWYLMGGGRFSSLEVVARWDSIDYLKGSSKNDQEDWYTIGVNWLVNDNATLGVNYVMKAPEKHSSDSSREINEAIVFMEIDV